MGQRPLQDWQIKRINQLTHDQGLQKSVVAKRLGISRSAVRINLMSEEEWQKAKRSALLAGSSVQN